MIAKLANGKTYTVPKNTILIKIPDKSEGIKQNTEIIFGGPLLTTYKTRADNVNRGCRVLFIPPPPLTPRECSRCFHRTQFGSFKMKSPL